VGVTATTEVVTRRGTPRVSAESEALLTAREVAELLNVPVSWVYERTRSRSSERIPGFRLGKYWRFREADILVWLEQQRVGAKSDA